MIPVSVNLKTRGVNNDKIIKQLDEFVSEILVHEYTSMLSPSERTDVVSTLEECICEYGHEEGTIEPESVRVTATQLPKRDAVVTEIQYTQRNCFNRTTLTYTISPLDDF